MTFTLSEDQELVYKTVAKWLSEGGIVVPTQASQSVLTMAGLAGTGKTTILAHLAKEFKDSIRFAFCALSGRAASVLGKKLKDQGVYVNNGTHYCGTIHKLIYKPIENTKGEVIYWARNKSIDYDIIVIDEASMISEDIFNDLKSYGVDILAVGDHGQLPPIDGKFSLMRNPDLRLEKIHRQAQDNKIINLSFRVRNGNYKFDHYSDNENVTIIKKAKYQDFLQEYYQNIKNPNDILDSAVLCYTNATRSRLNNTIRKIIFGNIDKAPVSNDLVMCLKNSKRTDKIPFYNGYRGYFASGIKQLDEHFISGLIYFPYEELKLYLTPLNVHQFGFNKTFSSFDELELFNMQVHHWSDVGLLFDYGYAMTCHKFQGSQCDNVIIYNERPKIVSEDNYRRWLYTAITRSSNKLTIIV